MDDRVLATYLDHLERGDRRGAVAQLLDLCEQGTAREVLALQVIAPAQVEVGRRWQQGRWSVAQEHRATSVSQAALAALELTGPREPPQRGEIAVGCIEGEWHTLPAELLGQALAWQGWHVTFLGPSMPAAHLAAYLEASPPFALALSCSLPSSLPGALASLEAARLAGVPCVVGGRGFGSDAARAEWLGANGWAANALGAAALLGEWEAEGMPPAPAPEADLDALRLLAERGDLVLLGTAMLRDRYPAMDEYSVEQLARTREDLGHIIDFAAAAQLVADPRIMDEFVLWLLPLLRSRGVPDAALAAGLEVLAEAVGEAHPFAAELLAGALPLVTEVASEG